MNNPAIYRKNKFLKQLISYIFSFETLFILYLFAGHYKTASCLQWVPVDITVLFFFLSVVVAIYILFKRGCRVSRQCLYLLLISLTFVIYIIVSLTWTPGYFYATRKAVFVATLTFWPLVATSLIIASDKHRLRRFLILVVAFACLIAIDSFVLYLKSDGTDFINPFGGGYLGAGQTIGMGVLICISYTLFYAKKYVHRYATIAIIFFLIWLLFVMGGRSALLGTMIAALFPIYTAYCLTSDGRVMVQRNVVYLFGIITLVGIPALLLPEFGIAPKTLQRFLVLFIEPHGGSSAGARLDYFVASISLWGQCPIWGHGIGSWPILMGFGDVRGFPHNIFLEIIVELGLVGLILFGILLVYAISLLGSRLSIRKDPVRILIGMLFISVFIELLVHGDLTDHRVFFGVLGLMVYGSQRENNYD